VKVAESRYEHSLYLCPELIIDKDVFLLRDRIERFRVQESVILIKGYDGSVREEDDSEDRQRAYLISLTVSPNWISECNRPACQSNVATWP
jgi:hypothetical protein